jgi:hypothetical protein
VLSLLLVEAGYRGYLYQTYVVDLNFQVVTADTKPPSAQPSIVYGVYDRGVSHWTRYQLDGTVMMEATVHTNNLGWVSRHDYHLPRKPREYRIAVVGDSFAASTTNNRPWPDQLQEILNSDYDLLRSLNVDRISVLNISLAGATYSVMAGDLFDAANRLDSDLILLNMAVGVFGRGQAPIQPATERSNAPLTELPSRLDRRDRAAVVIDGIQIPLSCQPPQVIANPDCRVAPVWYLEPGRRLAPGDVLEVKRQLAGMILLERVITALRPLALLEIFGHPIIPRTAAQAGNANPSQDSDQSKIDYVLSAIEIMRSMRPNTLFVVNPSSRVLNNINAAETKLQDSFVKAAAERSIPAVDMRGFLPLELGATEWQKWYVPNDGHWSDYGAGQYASALRRVIRLHLNLDDRPRAASEALLPPGSN